MPDQFQIKIPKTGKNIRDKFRKLKIKYMKRNNQIELHYKYFSGEIKKKSVEIEIN